MSPEERAIDVEAANARLATMQLAAVPPRESAPITGLAGKPVRKPCSDKGKPKPRMPAPQAPGALTTAQVLEITRLHAAEMLAQEIYTQAKLELVILADKAELAHRQAVAYLETLAGK